MPPETAPPSTVRQSTIFKGSRLELRGKIFAMSGDPEGTENHEKWRLGHRCGHQRADHIEIFGRSMQAKFVKFVTRAEQTSANLVQFARWGLSQCPLPSPDSSQSTIGRKAVQKFQRPSKLDFRLCLPPSRIRQLSRSSDPQNL